MQRVLSVWVAVAVSCFATRFRVGAEDAFVHLQTDRASYRLGETLWFRVHRRAPLPMEVVLFGPNGVEVACQEYLDAAALVPGKSRRKPADLSSSQTACTGSFLLPLEFLGGTWCLAVYVDGTLGHSLELDVYDLEIPRLRLDLTVLGRAHFPGQPVLAAFRATALDGKPIRGARVEYRAEFADLVLREAAGVTDDDGRAMIRFLLPQDVRDHGNLSAGLAIPGREGAVARPIVVASSVASVEFYPEGGAVVAGLTNCLALRIKDVHGRPTAAAGRIVDQQELLVATFQASPEGLCSVLVPYDDEGKVLRAVIDAPAGVTATFPLPTPSPDALSLHVEPSGDKADFLLVEVRAGRLVAPDPLVITVKHAGRELETGTVLLRAKKKAGVLTAQRSFRIPAEAALLEVFVEKNGSTLLVRPIFAAGLPAVRIDVRAVSPGPLLPGKAVELDLLATIAGSPAAVDLAFVVHQGETAGLQDLALRSALASYLQHSGCKLDPSLAAPEILDAFLIAVTALKARGPTAVDSAVEPSADGALPLVVPPDAPLSRRAGSPRVRPNAASRRSSAAGTPGTVVRSSIVEQKLSRAPFTRSALPPDEVQGFRARVAPEVLLAAPGLGKKARVPPQEVELPARVFDGRRTLLWASRVQTGRDGRARLRMKLNHIVADLIWAAQGFAAGVPISTQGKLVPTAEFETRVDMPAVTLVGDVLDLLVQVTSRGDGGPMAISVEHSPCLKALLRTRFTYDPAIDPKLHRMLFEVVEPNAAAELRLVATRGLYQETHRVAFSALRSGTELVLGTSGYAHGVKTLAVKVPGNALPGSVRLQASVAPSWLSESETEVIDLLAEPTGCFEQTSTKNYLNLLALRTLLELGNDPRALERGYRMAREGFAKITRFMDPSTGGFCPWENKGPDVCASVTGLGQLALHAQIFHGEGERELAMAMHWLEAQSLSSRDLLYLTSSLHDAGKTWRRSVEAALLAPKTVYEQALQAVVITSWPRSRPAADSLKLSERLARLLDRLEGAGAEAAPAQWGVGIMGSSGEMLSLEVLALAAGALFDGGRREAAGRALEALARSLKIPRATQGKLLALRTLARIGGPLHNNPLDVELTAAPGGTSRVTRVFQGGPPILFDLATQLGPGEKASLSLDVRSEVPLLYRLGCRYEVERPKTAPDAAFEIICTAPRVVDLGKDVDINLSIRPRQQTTSSQVVARVALPAGLSVAPEELAALMEMGGISFAGVTGDYLDIYWAKPIRQPEQVNIKAKATVAGIFTARPSTIYPYYESGREAYAEPLALKVHNNFGIDAPTARPLRLPPATGR